MSSHGMSVVRANTVATRLSMATVNLVARSMTMVRRSHSLRALGTQVLSEIVEYHSYCLTEQRRLRFDSTLKSYLVLMRGK